MCARSASAGTERSASRFPAIQSCSVAQRLALGRLRGELSAELGLAARALDEQHEPARDLERRRAAEVVLDEGEREIHPRRHAGGGVDVAVAHEDRVGSTVTCRVTARRAPRSRPSAWWPAPVEQAGLGQQEGAGAHRAHAPGTPAAARNQETSRGSWLPRAPRCRPQRTGCRSGRGSLRGCGRRSGRRSMSGSAGIGRDDLDRVTGRMSAPRY